MISMQMANEYTIEVGRIYLGTLEPREQRWSGLHQNMRAVCLNNVARLQTASACEGIACAQYGYSKLTHRRQITRSDGRGLWYYPAKRDPS